MSDIILCGVEEEEKFKLLKLIQIRCLVKDCSFDKAQLTSIPSIINFDQLGDMRVILYLCQNHYGTNRSIINNDNIFNKQIIFKQEIAKTLRLVKKNFPYEMILRQAELTLSRNSCCLRENLKYFNIKQVLTILELISNDHQLIIGLVKRVLIEKYMEFLEIKKEINCVLESNTVDILKYLTLLHRYKQIKNQITYYLRYNIKESGIILQPQEQQQIVQQYGY